MDKIDKEYQQPNYHEIVWTDDSICRLWNYCGSSPSYKNTYFARDSGHRILKEINSIVPLKGVILDIGCGPGHILEHLRSYTNWDEYIGIDSSRDSLAKINEIHDAQGRYVKAVRISEVDDCLKSDIADVVLCLEVIEHCNDQALDNIFSSAVRLLKPGGFFVLTTPNNEDLDKSMQVCPECGCVYHKWQHVRSWTYELLRSKLAEYGLIPLHIYTCDFTKDSLEFCLKEKIYLRIKYGKGWRYLQLNKPHMISVARLSS